jgi:spermidine synthase
MNSRERWILGVCFFVSGATGLILEVAWSKQLSYILGSSLYGSATVVAAFMAGLGLGSGLAGRLAGRFIWPVRVYAVLQFGIAICGAVSIPVFHAVHANALLGRFTAVFVLAVVPATLMGMTLPIVVGAYARGKERYGLEAGLMYGINTLGAMCGTWGAGFFLLPVLGLGKTCLVVAVSDGVVGFIALCVDSRLRTVSFSDQHYSEASIEASPYRARASRSTEEVSLLALFAISGAVAMVYEVGWFRLLGLAMGPSVYVFSAILGVFLFGVGFGSAASARWAERTSLGGAGAMAALESLLCLAGLGEMFYYNRLPQLNYELFIWATDSLGARGFFFGQIGIAAVVVLAPCLIMGALFPVTVRAVREAGRSVNTPEASIGRLYLMNTFGGIIGSLAAGFLLLPKIGVWRTLFGATLATGFLALAVLVLASQIRWKVRTMWATGLLIIVPALGSLLPSLDVALFNQGLYREAYATRKLDIDRTRQEQLVYFSEGINTAVAVFNSGGEATLRVSGKADASTVPGDFTTQLFVGHLPVIFAETPKRAAVIGYGSGMSAMAMLTHPEVESLDIIEIEQGVINASPYFDCISLNPLGDSRAHVVLDDARAYLTHTGKTYDVITSEPSNPWMAGISNLFTTDFYRIAHSRLSSNGVFGQWIQTYELSEETFKVIVASIHEVFPHVVIFRPVVGDAVVLASARPIQVPWEILQKRFMDERVLASFQRVDISNPFQLFFHFYASEDMVGGFVSGVNVRNTDDNVWLEYRMPKNMVEMGAVDRAEEHGIGIRLLEAGSDRRLDGFESMAAGVPIDALLRESLAYQYGMQLAVDRTGTVVDPWAAARSLIAAGLRSAVRRRSDSALSNSFDRWVSEGEANIRNRSNKASDPGLVETAAAAAFYQKGDLDNAETHFHNALRYVSSPAYYEALVGLGNIAAQHGRRDEAQNFYERAITRNPYHVIAFHNLAALFLGNDAAKLRSVVQRGLRFNPQDSLLVQFR